MGQKTTIEWTDSTVNSVTGCSGCELWHPVNKGPCYAGAIHEQRLAKSLPALYDADFTNVRLAPGRASKAAAWSDLRGKPRPNKPWIPASMPRLIFVDDMADLLSKAVPFEYLADDLFAAITSAKGSRHIWQILTKRPLRLAEFAYWLRTNRGVEWPENVWSGTSITTIATAKRIDGLLDVPGTRFLSLEPLREFVDLETWLRCRSCDGCLPSSLDYCPRGQRGEPCRPLIDHVIIGGESEQAPHEPHPFNVDWARVTIESCRAAGVPVFVKQLGSAPYDSRHRIGIDGPGSHAVGHDLHDHHGGDWSEWDEDLRVREFPVCAF